jgi:hypothetical protein
MRLSVVASIAIALLAMASLSGCEGMEDTADTAPVAVDPSSACDELASNAATFSGYMEDDPSLVKVRNPTVVDDNRDTYKMPAGSDQALVLACEGMGVGSNGSKSMVALSLTIGSDGQSYVDFQPK